MCGTDYCEACDSHAHAHGVHDWAEGHTHVLPEFGDAAQEAVARRERHAVILTILADDPTKVLAFPEVTAMVNAMSSYQDSLIMQWAGAQGLGYAGTAEGYDKFRLKAAVFGVKLPLLRNRKTSRKRLQAIRGAFSKYGAKRIKTLLFAFHFDLNPTSVIAAMEGWSQEGVIQELKIAA
jgi:hypothetical protein